MVQPAVAAGQGESQPREKTTGTGQSRH